MSDYRIGDEVYIHGIIDEIRKDTIIIKNEGGYFGTVADEIMPSAQPEHLVKESGNLVNGLVNDCISRQQAIDALDPLFESLAMDKIKALPSAQPEIIRCKDCRFQDKGSNESESWNLCGYRPWLHVPTEDEHYCGYAERRQDVKST